MGTGGFKENITRANFLNMMNRARSADTEKVFYMEQTGDKSVTSHQGKHIWIIGASSGIGEALSRQLATEGAHLILTARRKDKLEALNQDLGGKHHVLPVDVGDAKAMLEASHAISRLDSVIFMAAIYTPHTKEPKDLDFVHKALTVNLGGAFNSVLATLPIFEKQGSGQIALCGSVAGYRGLPYGQPYCATKAAVINYAESLKIELEDKNIDVKVINPGFVRTSLTDKNDFEMPMIIEPNVAAKALSKGLQSRAFEVHFPKRFTYLMKIIDILPRWIFFPVSRMMKRSQ